MLSGRLFGIGLRQPHYRDVFERRPALGFVEVHSENFFQEGGASLRALERARAAYPVSLHGVGLSLGATDEMSARHLGKLQRLAERIEPALVSEHLSWGRFGGEHFNDLLPMPCTEEALAWMVDRVDLVQSALRRPILVENLSAYVQFADDAMSDTAFLAALARRTGCQVLLDINNLYVNSINFGFDPARRLDDLEAELIGEIHLAGHEASDGLLIDTHGARTCPDVWTLYALACRRYGPKPTLIEWDTALPALDVLLDEVAIAQATSAAASTSSVCEAHHA